MNLKHRIIIFLMLCSTCFAGFVYDDLKPSVTGTHDLGTSALRWNDSYFSGTMTASVIDGATLTNLTIENNWTWEGTSVGAIWTDGSKQIAMADAEGAVTFIAGGAGILVLNGNSGNEGVSVGDGSIAGMTFDLKGGDSLATFENDVTISGLLRPTFVQTKGLDNTAGSIHILDSSTSEFEVAPYYGVVTETPASGTNYQLFFTAIPTGSADYEFEVDGTGPDTFKWRKDTGGGFGAYTNGVPRATFFTTLENNIKYAFNDRGTDTWTIGDLWEFTADAIPNKTFNVDTLGEIVTIQATTILGRVTVGDPTRILMMPNAATQFEVSDALTGRTYIDIDTVTGSEKIEFGNATDNPDYPFLGTGTTTINSLTASLGVYTDASKGLTSTAPSSGVLGYWSRTGTVVSTANAGDDITTTGTGTFNAFDLPATNLIYDMAAGTALTGRSIIFDNSDATFSEFYSNTSFTFKHNGGGLTMTGESPTLTLDVQRAAGGVTTSLMDVMFKNTTTDTTITAGKIGVFGTMTGPTATYMFFDIDTTAAHDSALMKLGKLGLGLGLSGTTVPSKMLEVVGDTDLTGDLTVSGNTTLGNAAGDITDINGEYTLPQVDGAAGDIITTDGANTATFKTPTSHTQIAFSMYDAEPARGSETSIDGAFLLLTAGTPASPTPIQLGPATPANDVSISKGTGKLVVVVVAGSDFAGDITVTGTSVDRDTGATTGSDTDTLTIDALTTDGSDTDANGNVRHAFTGAYITSKWFVGTVVLSSTTLDCTIYAYHVSFEQFDDTADITLDTFDVNLLTTSVNAEFDSYLYSIEVTGDKCDISREASLNIGAGGETALANRYWRLRRGNIGKALDGTTDGTWVDIHYSNSPAFVEDVSLKVWATEIVPLTLD